METLLKLSAVVATEESKEAKLAVLEGRVSILLSEEILSPEEEQEAIDLQERIGALQKSQLSTRKESLEILRNMIDSVQREEL